MTLLADEAFLAGVTPRFLHHLTSRGFEPTPPAPLTETDGTVTFVNASILPFKKRLLAGEQVGATCQFQPCVRSHGEQPFLFAFGMLGSVTDGAHLHRLSVDAPDAVLAALPWVSPDSLAFAVDRRDTDLAEAARPFLTRTGAELVLVDEAEIPTRWTYGTGGTLSGRGLTIVHRSGPPCAASCRPRCPCGRWLELGNIIAIDGPGRSYLEAGFGLEIMQATACGGDAYALPWIAAAVAQAAGAGLPHSRAVEAVNLYRALEQLTEAGAVPASRGPGYIVRKFAGRLLRLAVLVGDGDTAAGVKALCGTGAVSGLLMAESERRNRSGASRMAAARRYALAAPPGADISAALAATFGLARDEIAEICESPEQPSRQS